MKATMNPSRITMHRIPAWRFVLAAALGLPVATNAWAAEAPAPRAAPAKSSLGVSIGHSLAATAVGQASVLTLTATATAASASGVTITVRPDDALALTSSDLVVGEAKPLEGAATTTFALTVTPKREGLHYVNVFLRAGRRAQALAIAVPVGDAAVTLNKSSRVQSMPGGERVISVPARQ